MKAIKPAHELDAWTSHFAVAAADRQSERRRIQGAALVALLLHGLVLAVRLPESERPTPVPRPAAIPLALKDFVVRQREEPPPEPAQRAPVKPTIVVPGPPEIEVEPRLEPVTLAVTEILPKVEPLDFLPIAPPPAPPPETGPVRYNASIDRPERIYAPLPAYTPAARRIRREGRIMLEAIIDEHGAVIDATILKGLGFGLDESALETVSTWRFEPARRDGRPIAVIYNLVINFRLR